MMLRVVYTIGDDSGRPMVWRGQAESIGECWELFDLFVEQFDEGVTEISHTEDPTA